MTTGDLEDALIKEISTSLSYLKTVETYEGELTEKELNKFIKRFPAVLIYVERSKYKDRAYPKKWQELEFTLLVCDKNLRGTKQARRGGPFKPGVYKMLDDLFTAIFDKTLNLDIDPIDIDREQALVNTSMVSIYAAVYKTRKAKN